MVKVVRPLFSDSAKGPIADLGSFRMSPHGPQFIAQANPTDPKTERQLLLRDRFRQAKTAHTALDPGTRPAWPEFWLDWITDHPV